LDGTLADSERDSGKCLLATRQVTQVVKRITQSSRGKSPLGLQGQIEWNELTSRLEWSLDVQIGGRFLRVMCGVKGLQ
jgi:hypothetical protein